MSDENLATPKTHKNKYDLKKAPKHVLYQFEKVDIFIVNRGGVVKRLLDLLISFLFLAIELEHFLLYQVSNVLFQKLTICSCILRTCCNATFPILRHCQYYNILHIPIQ